MQEGQYLQRSAPLLLLLLFSLIETSFLSGEFLFVLGRLLRSSAISSGSKSSSRRNKPSLSVEEVKRTTLEMHRKLAFQ